MIKKGTLHLYYHVLPYLPMKDRLSFSFSCVTVLCLTSGCTRFNCLQVFRSHAISQFSALRHPPWQQMCSQLWWLLTWQRSFVNFLSSTLMAVITHRCCAACLKREAWRPYLKIAAFFVFVFGPTVSVLDVTPDGHLYPPVPPLGSLSFDAESRDNFLLDTGWQGVLKHLFLFWTLAHYCISVIKHNRSFCLMILSMSLQLCPSGLFVGCKNVTFCSSHSENGYL